MIKIHTEIDVIFDEKEFEENCRISLKEFNSGKRIIWFCRVLFWILITIMFSVVRMKIKWIQNIDSLIYPLWLVSLILISILTRKYMSNLMVKNAKRAHGSTVPPVFWSKEYISNEGIFVSNFHRPALINQQVLYSWNAMTSIIIYPDRIILNIQKKLFLFLPMRSFSPDKWNELLFFLQNRFTPDILKIK